MGMPSPGQVAALHTWVSIRRFIRLARPEGLPPIRLHELRHGTAITVSWQKIRDNARRPAVLRGCA